MRTALQHPLQWMRHETAVAGHWFSVHMVHDWRVWLYLTIALMAIALTAFLISAGGGITVNRDFRYYAYPYSAF